ncbi:hypothetical protein AAF712_016053, partial [Marasmius tenuissimus]
FPKIEATFGIEPTAPLPEVIIVGQTITAGWFRYDRTEPFDIALVYLHIDNAPFATQTLASNLPITQYADGTQHGTVTLMPTTTG